MKPPLLSVVTLWRSQWGDAQQAVLDYLLREEFPDATEFIWAVEHGSGTAKRLVEVEADSRLDRHSLHFLEAEFTAPVTSVQSKHERVAFLYNNALPLAEASRMLLVEDDVVAEPGTWRTLESCWAGLPAEKAACMVAYRSRPRPQCVCAGSVYHGYLPWEGKKPGTPTRVSWVGGGFTLYDAVAVKKCLPVRARNMGGWMKGWDVDLCEKLAALELLCFVTQEVTADHRFG